MSNKPKARNNENREESHPEEFIPFACHYNPNTLITKNGELLQTIKIVGFTFESVNTDNEELTLRGAIRRAISENIETSNFAIWIHTVRREKDLSTGGDYPEGGFAKRINDAWCERHDWKNKYVNELYVTVIRVGQTFKMGVGPFFRSLSFKAEKNYRNKYLDESFEKLNSTVERMLNSLEQYGARRLTMVESGGITYSQPIQFFHKVLNLKDKPIPAPLGDIAENISTHRTFFGFNALEVIGDTGDHFASILSVKEYHEMTSTIIDEFLQLEQQFIITETFDFINNKLVQKKFEHQKYLLELSGDKELGDFSGINDIVASDRGRTVDYGEHQITIMLVEDDLQLLEKETTRMLDVLHDVGVVTIREDVMLEDCYWSQLPGNFEFLRRLSPINTERIGGFASLYNFPAGKLDDNIWGDAVTVFYTKKNTPYFFNFHDKDNGHTTIIGPYGKGKTVLLNFLVSEAIKFNPHIYFFDYQRASELFIKALGGKYKRVLKDSRSTEMRFNPLSLEDTPENRAFLKSWLAQLMMDENYMVSEEVKSKLDEAIEYAYSLPKEQRKLSAVAQKFWPITDEERKQVVQEEMDAVEKLEREKVQKMLRTGSDKKDEDDEEELVLPRPSTAKGKLSFWHGEGAYAHFFDNDVDEFTDDTPINGFGLTEIVQEKWPIVPLLSYLMHVIVQRLDGRRTIIILDEAWLLVDNPVFAPQISALLDKMREKNAMVICATESIKDVSESSITSEIFEKIATQIYLPNEEADDVYKNIFKLTDDEFDMLSNMNESERNFLLKHHGEAVVAKLDLSGMHDIVAILSGIKENIALVESIILEVGDDPVNWLPKFKESLIK